MMIDPTCIPWPRAALEAVLITLAASALGIIANLSRPDPLPWLATSPYETLVPCPEPGGEATPLAPDDPLLEDPRTVLVSALDSEASQALPLAPQLVITYDYLDEVPANAIRAVAAARGARVVVVGDGDRPDSGEQLARELAGRGIRNVLFVAGGAPALVAARGSP